MELALQIVCHIFCSTYWEKQPLYIQRKEADRNYFSGIFSTEDFDGILRKVRLNRTARLKREKFLIFASGAKTNNNTVITKCISIRPW